MRISNALDAETHHNHLHGFGFDVNLSNDRTLPIWNLSDEGETEVFCFVSHVTFLINFYTVLNTYFAFCPFLPYIRTCIQHVSFVFGGKNLWGPRSRGPVRVIAVLRTERRLTSSIMTFVDVKMTSCVSLEVWVRQFEVCSYQKVVLSDRNAIVRYI